MRRHLLNVLLLLASAAVCMQPRAAASETAWFVVATRTPFPLPGRDSYVLPLSNPADIVVARSLAQGLGFMIVNARIAAGADGINRNVYAPGTPLWSWHVTEFLGFSNSAIELCDGSPTQVERDVSGWISGTSGTICFWAYTVVAEIPPPLPVGRATWGGIKAMYRL